MLYICQLLVGFSDDVVPYVVFGDAIRQRLGCLNNEIVIIFCQANPVAVKDL